MPENRAALPRRSAGVRYELHPDKGTGTVTIHRIETEIIGPFKNRGEARQYMLDTSEERKRAVSRV